MLYDARCKGYICMCSWDTIASSTWSNPQNECQLIDIFYSLLAASICCHRGRHRCDTVTHACLQPTRGLSSKADLNFCVRPSGGRLRIASHFFSDSFFLLFSKFSDQLRLRKKVIRKRVFLTHNLEFVVIIRNKKSTTFFLIHKSRPKAIF